jgi:hypothetical protein
MSLLALPGEQPFIFNLQLRCGSYAELAEFWLYVLLNAAPI